MAVSSFWAALTAPGAGTPAADRQGWYDYLWAWETGTIFTTDPATPTSVPIWADRLKAQYRLYRQTRLVWNPFPDLTDFWGSIVYPGVLTRDGRPAPDGTPSAFPLDDDTPDALVKAASQIWWWSGMAHHKYTIPYWAAVAGNVLLELRDDVPGRKVTIQPRWAGLVRDVDLNPAGDVLAYALEYPVTNAAGQSYVYRQEVDRVAFRTFRDGRPFDFSGDQQLGAAWPNTWGFVPACWVPHQPTGGLYSAPAIGPALPELLEINSLQSMLDDSVSRATKPIFTFATDGDVAPLFAGGKRGPTSEFDPADADRESLTAFKLGADATVGKLDPSADTAAVAAYLLDRKQEFYRHFPEVSMWESLRQRDVSGIAAEILHGDTRNKAIAIRAVTDRQLEKATQMAITMAGVRLNTGSWRGPLDSRHAAFRPYSLDSFGRGDLDFTLAARPLVPAAPLTETEKAQLADLRLNTLHLPAAWVYEQLGVPPEVITEAATAPPPPVAVTAPGTPPTVVMPMQPLEPR